MLFTMVPGCGLLRLFADIRIVPTVARLRWKTPECAPHHCPVSLQLSAFATDQIAPTGDHTSMRLRPAPVHGSSGPRVFAAVRSLLWTVAASVIPITDTQGYEV